MTNKKITARDLQTPTARARLAPRDKPYAIPLLRGLHLGYRRPQSPAEAGSWVVISADGEGGRWTKAFATANDKLPPDGSTVLDYEQAVNKARALWRGDTDAASSTAPANITQAINAYEANLKARGRDPANAQSVRYHMPAHLLPVPLSQVTSKQLLHWRDSLITDDRLPATVNRIIKATKAAFRLAAKLDKRITANAEAWRVGLEALPDTVTARDAVLTEKQVLKLVSAAYDVDEYLGTYVAAHAEVGARSSQLVRCVVGDLHADKLMVPRSRKGRKARGGHVGVPLQPGLADRLHKLAAGRSAHEPLFIRSDGTPWQAGRYSMHAKPFARAAKAAGLPTASMYSLRHSSIAHALLRGLPIKVTADWHDTSVPIIERHYARFISNHTDDLIRAVLRDTTPPVEQSGKVVKLRA